MLNSSNFDAKDATEVVAVYRNPQEYSVWEDDYHDRAMLAWLLDWFDSGLIELTENRDSSFAAKVLQKHLERVISSIQVRMDNLSAKHQSGLIIDPNIPDYLLEKLQHLVKEDPVIKHDLRSALLCMRRFNEAMSADSMNFEGALDMLRQLEYSIRLIDTDAGGVRQQLYQQMEDLVAGWLPIVARQLKSGGQDSRGQLYLFMRNVVSGIYRGLKPGNAPRLETYISEIIES